MQRWYQKHGYEEDPLSSKPRFGDDLIDVQPIIDDLTYYVEAGSMIFLQGPPGSGKTAYLYKLIDTFGGEQRVIYFNCGELGRGAEIDVLMKNRYGLAGRLLNQIPRNMIVLLDNIQTLTSKNAERVKFYFDQDYIQSLVFTGAAYSQKSLTPSIRDRIGRRVLKTAALSKAGCVTLLTQRLGEDQKLIPDALIGKLYQRTGGNPKAFLEDAALLCRYALSKGSHVSLANFEHVFRRSNVRAMV